MKKGYIQAIDSVTEFQKIVTMMNNAGVECDEIAANQTFVDFAKTLYTGDVAVVYSLVDCFKNLAQLMSASIELSQRGIRLESITDAWYDNSPTSLALLKGIADMTSRIRSNRTQLGLLKLKAQGRKLGRPVGSVKIKDKVAAVEKLHKESNLTIAKACASVGCNPRSYYRYIKENNHATRSSEATRNSSDAKA